MACAPEKSGTTTPTPEVRGGSADDEHDDDGEVTALMKRFEAWKSAPAKRRNTDELEAVATAALGLDSCEDECVDFVLHVGMALEAAADAVRADDPAWATSLLETKLRTEMMTGIHEMALMTASEIIDARGDLDLARRALEDVLRWESGLEYDEKVSDRFSRAALEKRRRFYRSMGHAALASLAIGESRFEDAIVELDAAAAAGHRSLRSHQERARALSALAGGLPDAATRRAAADACFADFVDQPGCLLLFDVKTPPPPPDDARREAAIEAARRRTLDEDARTDDALRVTRPAVAYADQHGLDDRPTLVAVGSKYCKPCKDEPEELAEVAAACPGARLLLMWETDDGEAPVSHAENLEIVAVDEAASQPSTGYPHHAVFSGGEVVYAGNGASLDGWWRFMFELEAAGAACSVPAYPNPSGRTGWGTHASPG